MKADRKHLINEFTEIQIGNCYFTKSDIQMMYIDSGMSIVEFGRNLGIGRIRAAHILEHFGIIKSWKGEMTPRRLRVIRFLSYFQRRYNRSPNLQEISRALRIPASSVCIHMKNLKKLGYVDWQRYKKGTFRLTEKGKRWCKDAHTFNLFGLEENRQSAAKHER